MERLIGVDIGGTRTRVGAVLAGRILARRAFPTRGVPEVRAAIQEVLEEVGWARPDAIGVGAPAPLDMRQGRILHAPNLPHWNGVNVVEELGRAFACPVFLGNDANCAAVGELAYGWRAQDFLYVTWSTGIGGGIVAGGQVVWGATGQAGEIGHIPLRPDGPRCNCGKRGCLEALAGGAGLRARAQERLGLPLSAQELVERARRGEPGPLALVEEACAAMGQGLAIAAELLEPEMIILGGGFTASWDFLGPKVRAAFEDLSRVRPRLELTKLGDDVGLLGAAALPLHFPRF
ncbi:MAG: ROK family protein [Candidatus Bipolaricaulota bacterium]|nr:ROK family protein [Candidatus Bipolaricaulota bacterium]MCX7844698.1 ROK family protein [Candidatus Bipolaricaulota bacterium]MDW8152410.1 ROK family protein [Candidatus Bipolaricaulota bacterium]